MNRLIATLAFAGCLVLAWVAVRSPHPFPGVLAVGLTVAAFGTVAWLHGAGRIIRTPASPRPVIEAAPVRLALPPRTPVEWALPMYEELELVSPQLRLAIHRTFLLLLEKHASEWGDEIARELQAAQRHVIRGEIAS